MLITLISSDFGLGYEIFPVSKRLATRYEKETGHESVLFQSDWDFPGLASNLGWRGDHKRNCPNPGSTDGTVTCAGCGLTASYFIQAAGEWLDERVNSSMRPRGIESYFGW